MIKNWKIIFLFALVLGFGLPGFLFAEDLATQCAAVSEANGCTNLSKIECNAFLQRCVTYYDQQAAAIAQDLTKTAAQKNTLSTAISKLKKNIQSLEANISQGKIMVKDLNLQISDTSESIDKTSADIEDSQNQISSILQSIYEEDQKPAFFILLEGNLSNFFGNMVYLESLNSKVGDLLESTKKLQTYLQDQKEKMGGEVIQLQKTIALQTLQKQENEQNKKQQDEYLQMTEAQYQAQLREKQEAEKNSAKIKSMLFQVVGITKAPTFGEAISIAKYISSLISIRPAFLLAVISQESALGRVVGNCLLTNTTTGEGKKTSTGAYMPKVFNKNGYHPNDLSYFLQITSSVGRDPLNSMISCDGFGSMGPAQFLPATWWLFVDRLKAKLGHTADPWVVQDAFAASAMYLTDLQARYGTEAMAAQRYNGSGAAAVRYSKTVMTRADCIQTFIDAGTMSSYCQGLIF